MSRDSMHDYKRGNDTKEGKSADEIVDNANLKWSLKWQNDEMNTNEHITSARAHNNTNTHCAQHHKRPLIIIIILWILSYEDLTLLLQTWNIFRFTGELDSDGDYYR